MTERAGHRRRLAWWLGLSLWAWPAVAWSQDVDPKLLTKLLDFDKLLLSGLVFGTAMIIARVLSAALDQIGERLATRRLLLKRIASLTRFAVYIAATLFIIFGIIQPERDTLLALGTAMAVTIALALKDLAGSIIAGVIILIDAPFQVGDRVQFGDTYGEVTEIGLRTVKITTLDDNLVSIPNNRFLADVVSSANAGALDMMVVLKFHIGIDEDHALAKRLVYEATLTSRYTFLQKPIRVHVAEVFQGDTLALRISSKFYVIDTRYETAISTDITERVHRAFAKAGLRSPYSKQRSEMRLATDAATAPLPAPAPALVPAPVPVPEDSAQAPGDVQAELLQAVRALQLQVEALRAGQAKSAPAPEAAASPGGAPLVSGEGAPGASTGEDVDGPPREVRDGE